MYSFCLFRLFAEVPLTKYSSYYKKVFCFLAGFIRVLDTLKRKIIVYCLFTNFFYRKFPCFLNVCLGDFKICEMFVTLTCPNQRLNKKTFWNLGKIEGFWTLADLLNQLSWARPDEPSGKIMKTKLNRTQKSNLPAVNLIHNLPPPEQSILPWPCANKSSLRSSIGLHNSS